MKCNFCNKKTDMDSSVGRIEFIVCNKCVDKIVKNTNKKYEDIVLEIIKIGIYKNMI